MCDEQLLAVTVLHRHGARTPLSFYSNDPHKNSPIWTVPPGDLINLGKKQMFELGQWFRKRYDGFLSKNYKQNEIYVVSSDKDRCIASASLLLAGLYPPVGDDVWHPTLPWQPVPVHSIPREHDKILNFFESREYLSLLAGIFKPVNEKYKPLLEYLSQHSGQQIRSIVEATYLRDILSVETEFNLTLPDWTHEVYPQKLNEMRAEVMSGKDYTIEMKQYSVGRFFDGILAQFEVYSSQLPTNSYVPKMKMFSGHDMNIHIILEALETPHSLDVPYAAALMFELRRSKMGELFVQLVYKTDNEKLLELK